MAIELPTFSLFEGRERLLPAQQTSLETDASSATSAAGLGVWRWDFDSDTVMWENERAYGIFGLAPSDPPLNGARLLAQCVHEDYVDALRDMMRRVRITDALAFVCRICRMNDRQTRWIVLGRCARHAGLAHRAWRWHQPSLGLKVVFFPESRVRVFLYGQPTDMRKSFDGLYALARGGFDADPLAGHLFVFANRRGTQLKVLYFDRSGWALWAKRLEAGRFVRNWPEVRGGDIDCTARWRRRAPDRRSLRE